MKFKDYLKTYDARWVKLLECIEQCGAKPVHFSTLSPGAPMPEKHIAEDSIFENAWILEHKAVFKDQLHTYLGQYTESAASLAVSAAGVNGVCETYRKMVDTGRSRRPEHLLRLQREVLNPGAAKGYKDLDGHVVTWEHNINYFHRVAPKEQHVTDSQRRLILISMPQRIWRST